MKGTIIMILAIFAACPLFAQSDIQAVMTAIEQNNTTLKALRKTYDAEKTGNKTGIYLEDPEIGFNYLWGNPSETGSRQDISVTQSFDLPTISGKKKDVAIQKNEMIEWQYKTDRMSILLEAKLYLLDIVYYNGLLRELAVRKANALSIVSTQKQRMDKGEGNILEYNNVRMTLSLVEAEMKRVETERDAINAQLTRLNGGNSITLNSSDFTPICLPTNFKEWFDTSAKTIPFLAYARSNISLSKKQLSATIAMRLPTFSLGYMSENTKGQRYQGVSLGMSLPLWSNKNKVKQAKEAVEAAQYSEEDAIRQYYGQMEILYQRTKGLQKTTETYRSSLQNSNNSPLLKTALDAGEISILDYLMQVSIYYDSIDKALAAERDYQKAFAELTAFDL